jgi:uncharacterized protein (TIGR02611 family)
VSEETTHPRIEKLRERKARHKRRSKPYRIGFGVVGVVLVLAGLVLSLPLVPGPGFLLVFVGLAMLALEFDRVEKVMAGAAAAVAVAAFVAAGLLWDLPLLPF